MSRREWSMWLEGRMSSRRYESETDREWLARLDRLTKNWDYGGPWPVGE